MADRGREDFQRWLVEITVLPNSRVVCRQGCFWASLLQQFYSHFSFRYMVSGSNFLSEQALSVQPLCCVEDSWYTWGRVGWVLVPPGINFWWSCGPDLWRLFAQHYAQHCGQWQVPMASWLNTTPLPMCYTSHSDLWGLFHQWTL